MTQPTAYTNTSIRIKIEERQYQNFGLIAMVRGIPKHELVAEALDEFVKNHFHEVDQFREKIK